jgi:hypothetical protein
MISGISYGMVELIRRIIPRDIVGGDVQSMYKICISCSISHLIHLHHSLELRKMDALVHILYEVAGTCGALLSVKLIQCLRQQLLIPHHPALVRLSWHYLVFRRPIGSRHRRRQEYRGQAKIRVSPFHSGRCEGLWPLDLQGWSHLLHPPTLHLAPPWLFRCAYVSSSSLFPLILSSQYSNRPPVYGHRYLENGFSPLIAKRVMNDSSFSVRTLLQSQLTL